MLIRYGVAVTVIFYSVWHLKIPHQSRDSTAVHYGIYDREILCKKGVWTKRNGNSVTAQNKKAKADIDRKQYGFGRVQKGHEQRS